MSLTTQVDTSRFHRAVDLALANTSRELSVATNARMYFLLHHALRLTKRASRQAIEKLGVYSFKYYTRKGTIAKKARSIQTQGNVMTYIRLKQRKDGGFIRRTFTSRAEVAEAAKLWTTRKLSAIGFLASLWVKPIRRFDRYAAQKLNASRDAQGNIKNHESVTTLARPAQPGFSPVAEAGFVVGEDARGDALRGYAQTLLNTALRRAMNVETAAIMRHLEEKAKKACRDAGMDVRG
jgi:hypothetical protein